MSASSLHKLLVVALSACVVSLVACATEVGAPEPVPGEVEQAVGTSTCSGLPACDTSGTLAFTAVDPCEAVLMTTCVAKKALSGSTLQVACRGSGPTSAQKVACVGSPYMLQIETGSVACCLNGAPGWMGQYTVPFNVPNPCGSCGI